ncbi:Alanine--tRNA ligase, cytoplasmic [Operophtera brumata]|uniref:Alanine--tRNA ligase, cytoplasmic n=1 Tax=Operophtera brumata TaxID=104452 RepID=A0A0L7L3Q0_OPEBR|nr:Alanine--tRNA ligase, cytoplasmic [Operophtera brumata]
MLTLTYLHKDYIDCQTDSDEPDEPAAKRLKINSLNLQVYQIPAFNTPKSLSIFPSSPVLPKFVNNPLNLANPLALASEANNIVKNLQTRFSLPAKLSITPVQAKNPFLTETGEVIRSGAGGTTPGPVRLVSIGALQDDLQPEEEPQESDKFPFDKCPQYWYASEESLRLHKKRKHPYSAMFNLNWYCSWRDAQPNS